MRQRGAAGRDIGNSNFRLSFGFGEDRDERQQIRQRRSGTRRIDATDFGRSVRRSGSRSRSRTPALGVSNNRKAREASVRRSREPSLPLARRSASAQQEGRDVSQDLDDRGSRPSKRWRTTLREVQQRQINPSMRAEKDNSSKRISLGFPMSEDIIEEEEDIPVELDDSIDPGLGPSWSPTVRSTENYDKENPEHTGGKAIKRKKRKSIGQQSIRRKKRSSGASTLTVDAKEINNEGRASSQVDAEIDSVTERQPSAKPTSTKPVGLSKKQHPVRRKKRKSVVLPRKKRRSSENTRRLSARSAASPELTQDIRRMAQLPVEDEIAIPPRKRNVIPRAISIGTPQDTPIVVRSIEVDEVSDDEYFDEDNSPEPPTPAPNKRPAKSAPSKKGNRTHRAINSKKTQQNIWLPYHDVSDGQHRCATDHSRRERAPRGLRGRATVWPSSERRHESRISQCNRHSCTSVSRSRR